MESANEETVRAHLRRHGLSAGLGHVVRHHPSPPEILRPHRVRPFPEQQRHQRRANLFAGFQPQVRQLLARDDLNAVCAVARESSSPIVPASRRPVSRRHRASRGLCRETPCSCRNTQYQLGLRLGGQDRIQRPRNTIDLIFQETQLIQKTS